MKKLMILVVMILIGCSNCSNDVDFTFLYGSYPVTYHHFNDDGTISSHDGYIAIKYSPYKYTLDMIDYQIMIDITGCISYITKPNKFTGENETCIYVKAPNAEGYLYDLTNFEFLIVEKLFIKYRYEKQESHPKQTN